MTTAFEEFIVKLPDGYEAYGRFWPVDKPRGAVLYHHGIQSHCGWYEASAAALARAGFAVLQVDRRGCGRNANDRGHAESADQLIADAHAARDELRRRTSLQNYHVVGVSWGGKLAVAAYVNDPAGVRSLSLVTPGLFPRIGVSRDAMAQIGFAMIYEPRKLFDIPLDDPEMFTSDPHWQHFIKHDERTLRQCTAGFFLASRRMDRIIARLPELPPVPVQLFLAGDERILDDDKTVAFFQRLGWPRIQFTRHPESRHSLEFEASADRYFEQLVDFSS